MRVWPLLFVLAIGGCGTAGRDDVEVDAAADGDGGDAAIDDVAPEVAPEAGADVASDAVSGDDGAAPDAGPDAEPDAGTDVAADTALDATVDAGPDVAADTAVDATVDAEPDVAADTAVDATVDAGPDVAADTAVDSGADAADSGADATDAAAVGPIKGGPCASGAIGATAFRLRWAGSGPGSTAYVVYEVQGLPDTSTLKAGAYGSSTSYKPIFDDTFLGVGGLVLSGTNFVDVDFSTVGITTIKRATLSIHGRSFATTASGSFNWLTFDGAGATPTGAVANSAPYEWYGPLPFLGSGGPIGDATAAIVPGKTTKLRIKAGGPSGALIVHWIELCLDAT